MTAETYSKIINNQDRNTKPLFSDAAAAVLLGKNFVLKPGRFTFGTDGSRFESLILKKNNELGRSYNDYLHMDGRVIFELVASEVPKDIEKCLLINHLTKEEIDFFVFHQASIFMLDTLERKINLEGLNKVVKCVEQFGNTVSSSIPIALKDIICECNKKSLKIFISGFGVGASWASNVLSSTEGEKNV